MFLLEDKYLLNRKSHYVNISFHRRRLGVSDLTSSYRRNRLRIH